MLRLLLPWGPGHPLVTSGSGVLVYGRGCITSFNMLETTGSAAALYTFHDGTGTNMQILFDQYVASSTSATQQWNLHCLPFEEGIYIDNKSGTAKGSFVVWAEHWCRAYLMAPHRAAVLDAAEDLHEMGLA